MKTYRKSFASDTKALEETRSLIVTISTPAPDRMGDVVSPKGAQLTNYLKNPVVLFGHNYAELPVAKATELMTTDEGIQAKVQFPPEGIYDKADTVYEMYKSGYMNAWSIGFSANQKDAEVLKDGGYKFNSWELLEFSAVPVPANAEALTVMRSKGLEPTEDAEETEDVAEDDEPAEVDEATESVSEDSASVDEGIVSDIDESADDGTVTLHFTDGTTKQFSYQPAKKIEPEPEIKGVPMTIETLKLVDQIVGRALRDFKAQQLEAGQ